MKIKRILIISGAIGFVVGLAFFVLASLWTVNETSSKVFMVLGETILWPVTKIYPYILFNPSMIFPNYIMVLLTTVYFCLIGLILWKLYMSVKKIL